MNNKNICIDCRMIDSSGVGIYLNGCLPYFIKSGNNIFLLGISEKLKSFLINTNVTIINCNIKIFSIIELFFFPKYLLRQINNSDIFFSPYFNIISGIKIPVYITIHDIIFPDMPDITTKFGLAIRMFFFKRAYKKAKKIFTVSEFSKSRIMFHLRTTKPIIVTYSAIHSMFIEYRKNNSNFQKTNSIIFIGNIKKHKGLNILLDAFFNAKNEGLSYKLLIIGSKENLRTIDDSILKKIDLLDNDSIQFTGFITNEQLMEYISTASLLIQPSLYEGFCLPPLEALVLGTPVLISDIHVLKEIYVDFPVTYFKAGDILDLKTKMLELLQKNISPPVLSDYQLSKYTFEKTSSIILKELTA